MFRRMAPGFVSDKRLNPYERLTWKSEIRQCPSLLDFSNVAGKHVIRIPTARYLSGGVVGIS
jgi:hypothetical protein